MKFCPKCGAKVLVPEAKFCMECGFNLDNLKTLTNDREISDMSSVLNIDKQNDANLEMELQVCREYAERGYTLAKEKYVEMQQTLEDERQKLLAADKEQSQMNRLQNTKLIEEQKQGWERLANRISKINEDIEMLHERQKDFSIIIYGRTMAGKSTLMEILTHGNGASIGKGAQRTTLDVRDYYWNGLRITDVPGVCSFGGAEDDRLAFEAARSADLILFLLTDDAPQAGEAECLAQLRSLGKPVLGIINVKMAFDMNRRDLSLKKLRRLLEDTERIETICQQFKSFAKNYEQDWQDIEFVSTHLNAAFVAQPERGNDEDVFAASNFAQVERFILDKVRTDGKFLRIKNFVDIAAVPICQIVKELYAHAGNSLIGSKVWASKAEELMAWRETFIERIQKRSDEFAEHINKIIENEMEKFVDENYENKKAGEDWEKKVNSLNLPQKFNAFLQEVADECDKKRKELSDELTQELKYHYSGSTDFAVEMGDTTPYAKYAWHIASNALMFVPGIGWAARIGIGVGGALLGMLFNNKEDNIRENKKKLHDALVEGTNPMIEKMHNDLVRTINEQILEEGVNGFYRTLEDMENLLVNLGTAQSEIATVLCKKYKSLNIELLKETITYTKASAFVSSVDNIARIPGQYFLLVSENCKLDCLNASILLGENFQVKKVKNNYHLVSDLIGDEITPKYFQEYDEDGNISMEAKIYLADKSANTTLWSMAEQIIENPIIMEG